MGIPCQRDVKNIAQVDDGVGRERRAVAKRLIEKMMQVDDAANGVKN
ncbi:hypothetical protein HMPREF3190_01299 [Umbribacter vaginalis]|nr:hypothetical protein HMPREF3190_01299 [Coriobacteriales bacterium DNF00809]